MKITLRYVGLDVHADTIVVAVAAEGRESASSSCRRSNRRLRPGGEPVSVRATEAPTVHYYFDIFVHYILISSECLPMMAIRNCAHTP
jgi:hypothetical protein